MCLGSFRSRIPRVWVTKSLIQVGEYQRLLMGLDMRAVRVEAVVEEKPFPKCSNLEKNGALNLF